MRTRDLRISRTSLESARPTLLSDEREKEPLPESFPDQYCSDRYLQRAFVSFTGLGLVCLYSWKRYVRRELEEPEKLLFNLCV
jgi:hypothetical protein